MKSVVYQAHVFLRRKSPESGVSLRDIKRVVSIIKWAHKYLTMMQDELKLKKKSAIIMATILTVNLCYGIRLNGMKSKKFEGKSLLFELYDNVYKKSIPIYVKMN